MNPNTTPAAIAILIAWDPETDNGEEACENATLQILAKLSADLNIRNIEQAKGFHPSAVFSSSDDPTQPTLQKKLEELYHKDPSDFPETQLQKKKLGRQADPNIDSNLALTIGAIGTALGIWTLLGGRNGNPSGGTPGVINGGGGSLIEGSGFGVYGLSKQK